MEVNTFIIAKTNIDDYSSDEFNHEYNGLRFKIEKHGILAIGDAAKVYINNDTRELEDIPSIIRILKIDETSKAIAVDTDGDFIKVKLSSAVCDNYKCIGNNAFSYTAFSLVILPAVMLALLRCASDEENYSNRKWYEVLEKALERKGYQIDKLSASDNSLLNALQELFDNPIAKAFGELINVKNRVEEN